MKSPILYVHYTAIFDLNSAKKEKSVLNPNVKKKKEKFKKWRGVTIYGHFAKAIVRQNGYKIVDFGNEVLNNRLDD